MPGGFPLGLEICNGTSVGANANGSAGVQVNANASANVVGSWVQLIASTAADSTFMAVFIEGFVNLGPNGAVDIGVGGAGNEMVIASQLMTNYANGNGSADVHYIFPVAIPAGTRIAARSQVDRASDGVFVNLTMFDGAFTQFEGYAGVDSIGFSSAATTGTQVDPGAVLNTKGSYAQLIASTTRDYAGLLIAGDALGQKTGSGTSLFNFSVDIAIGGAGSEKIIIPDIAVMKDWQAASIAVFPAVTGPFWTPVPSGTRIAARCQADSTDATGRLIGITAYGIYQ